MYTVRVPGRGPGILEDFIEIGYRYIGATGTLHAVPGLQLTGNSPPELLPASAVNTNCRGLASAPNLWMSDHLPGGNSYTVTDTTAQTHGTDRAEVTSCQSFVIRPFARVNIPQD